MLNWEGGAGRAKGGTMGLHLVSGWWCRGCRGLHGGGARWRRIGRDEVTSCGSCIPQAGRCNAGVGRASSFGPFLDRIGSSGTGMHSNLLRSPQASGPMPVQKRPADRKHGPASHGTKAQESHSAGRRARGQAGAQGPGAHGCTHHCRTARLRDRRAAGGSFRCSTCAPPHRLMKTQVPKSQSMPLSPRPSCTSTRL